MGSENEQPKEIAVVMVPLPAQGHLNPLLHLSSQIAAGGIHVHYVSSATHNRQARHRFHGLNLAAAASHLHFHDLDFPSGPNPKPNPDNPVKFPTHLQPSFDATWAHLLPHLSSLLISLSPSHRRIALLVDSAMSFAIDAASAVQNAEAFAFHPSSAICSVCYLDQTEFDGGAAFRSFFSEGFLQFINRQRPMKNRVAGRLFNTCRWIEQKYLDRLSEKPVFSGQRIFAIGPLNPAVAAGRSEGGCLISWLDEQPAASVVYVSFGTTSTMSKEQVREIAAGLEASRQRFIWVRRDADRCDIFEDGEEQVVDFDLVEFEKRMEGKGKLVRGWAPQLEILAHPSIGGFLSHCGWNSCLEAMSSGVPILAWPMHSDQPANAFLVTEVLMTGIPVKKGTAEEELVTAETVRESLERLMAGGDEGKELRRRAREMGEKLRAAVKEGGSSKQDFDAFLDRIMRP
ncbi:putative cis-zeatin O-glucosyltransferase [Platanthera zijinensis]|uniref:Glycosyltransferase n=1 Tax=Platanthera zijinensis TaxID=2320716 RepID=A0AAP0BXI4_9ASPA